MENSQCLMFLCHFKELKYDIPVDGESFGMLLSSAQLYYILLVMIIIVGIIIYNMKQRKRYHTILEGKLC